MNDFMRGIQLTRQAAYPIEPTARGATTGTTSDSPGSFFAADAMMDRSSRNYSHSLTLAQGSV